MASSQLPTPAPDATFRFLSLTASLFTTFTNLGGRRVLRLCAPCGRRRHFHPFSPPSQMKRKSERKLLVLVRTCTERDVVRELCKGPVKLDWLSFARLAHTARRVICKARRLHAALAYSYCAQRQSPVSDPLHGDWSRVCGCRVPNPSVSCFFPLCEDQLRDTTRAS